MNSIALTLGLAALTTGLAWAAEPGSAVGASLSFLEPGARSYRLESLPAGRSALVGPQWIRAWPASGSTNAIEFGSKVVLKLASTNELSRLLAGTGLRVSETLRSNAFVLQAPDAQTAVRAAAWFAGTDGVLVSHPVRRRGVKLHGGFASRPDDTLWGWQWHLENRDLNSGERRGFDLNVRAAWPETRGADVVVAIGDDGMETSHPDLRANTAGTPHYNFFNDSTSGAHVSSGQSHGTAVAGLIAAQAGNGRGVSGVAPAARLASWVIFDASQGFVDELQSKAMFQHASNVVSVQNHSWGNADFTQLPLGLLEDEGIENAVKLGRSGRGVVLVRAAGNEREQLNDANDDGYANDPRTITVGAVRNNGRVTSYSTPGACVLVAGFSADDKVGLPDGSLTNYPTLGTTDRAGSLGYNTDVLAGYADYAFGSTGFSGTSGATPQLSGVCALVLSANPELAYRDAQQVLIFSARQLDAADPAVRPNGAGLRVSHSTGFGVPDAARAVALARIWKNRPAAQEVSFSKAVTGDIPDDGLRVNINGVRVPIAVQSIPAYPGDLLHVDSPSGKLPLVDVGRALEPIAQDLRGKGALIQRGGNYFVEKVAHAAAAGAEFAVIYNNVNGTERLFMNGADIQFSTIPAVFIDQTRGEALSNYLAQTVGATAEIALNSVVFKFPVNDTLQCEHVSLRLRTTHTRRADVRVTLVSPAGTRSVLHHFNRDENSPLDDWTFHSVQHFYECSAGEWRVEVSDEKSGVIGSVTAVDLTIRGVRIQDQDRDGLDDGWEVTNFGNLAARPGEDPDHDGASNLLESLLGTDPRSSGVPLALDLLPWDAQFWRLSSPGTPGTVYRLFAAPDVGGAYSLLGSTEAPFGVAEWIVPADASPGRYFRLEASPKP